MGRFTSQPTSRRQFQPELIPLSEAAAMMSRSPRTLRRWIKIGLLPGCKLSGQIMIRPADLKAMIERARDF